MTPQSESRQWINELLLQGEKTLQDYPQPGANDWINSIRYQARSSLEEIKIPARKDEIWRYSNVDKLFNKPFKMNVEVATDLQDVDYDEYVLLDDSYQVVIANGHCVSLLAEWNGLSDAVTISSLSDALVLQTAHFTAHFGQAVKQQTTHIFSALNTALMNDGVFIHIGAGIKLDKPIEIIYLNMDGEASHMFHLRNLVVMDEGSSATIIERYLNTETGDNQTLYFNNNLTEIVLHEKAALQHYRIQDESKNSYHMGNISISQMAESEYNNSTFAMGGHWSRTEFNVDFRGQFAQCNLNGLYTVGEQQLIDFHSKIQHSVPNCSSQENFKGILYGKGRAVFDGHIVVDKEAQGTDAHMFNANLLLTRKAEIDTKPQLEIYADDVKCSHGTTVGQLEPEQLFYLRSRGIDESRAKQMLCLGFAAQIINTIEIDSLADTVTGQLQDLILVLDEVNP